MRLILRGGILSIATTFLLNVDVARGAVALDAMGLYLTSNGYGGAQLVRVGNFYDLPINSNGKPGNLIIDTGAPATLIFRSSLKTLALTESKTNASVSGAFGKSREFYGTATINALRAGNCIFTNVPVAVIPPLSDSPESFRGHGGPSGVLGLRELSKFGAIVDLPHRLIYFRPPRSTFDTNETARLVRTSAGWRSMAPGSEFSHAIRSILTERGWTPVAFSIENRHLRVPAMVNGVSCYLRIDTGAHLTILDGDFAKRAKIAGVRTRISAQGIGKSAGEISVAVFPSLRIGNYEIKQGSAMVGVLDPEAIGRGTRSEVNGLLGIEHLALNSAIFDFVSRTLYLRPSSR